MTSQLPHDSAPSGKRALSNGASACGTPRRRIVDDRVDARAVMDDDVARCVAFARARGATELELGRLRDARATMDALRAKDATTTLGAIGWGKTLGARVRIAREAFDGYIKPLRVLGVSAWSIK